jgi:hypothetical protein
LITAALKHKGGRVRRPTGVTGEQQQHCGCLCEREFGDEKARYGALAPLRGTAYKAFEGWTAIHLAGEARKITAHDEIFR